MTTLEKINRLTNCNVIFTENGKSRQIKIDREEAWTILDCTEGFTKKYFPQYNTWFLKVNFPTGASYMFLDPKLAELAA